MKLSALRPPAVCAALLVGAAAPVHADAAPGPAPVDCPVPASPPSAEDLERYVCGDPRLGPAELPEDGPVAQLTSGYEPFGSLSPREFLETWRSSGDTWDYPPHDGFAVEDGEPVTEPVDLEEGDLLDRFGSPHGTFLAPAGAPFEERALPPDSLNTWPQGNEHNYSCYEVTTGFEALTGPIAPHFEQPGGGEQILVPADGLPGVEADTHASAAQLMHADYVRERPAELCVEQAQRVRF
ncbi:TNT domain-containing protein [Nocardiopsis sp. HNM0947]|uniref:TNT domain-containing protein n=1 Tax=Nocardiopsis coralli TaxID=2772213 RepID=A0ABR9P667_9ACTN|nr:TNT domain-containing protein [Nocardiopsis coralli]MBE2999314.1 TNT domain-containing protein [Nocardiopsis coralli]